MLLFLLGLLVNAFPFFHLQTLRIPGVLQRIALCYLGASVLYLALSPSAENPSQSHRRAQVLFSTILALLAFYWAMLRLYPVPGFGPGHLDSLANVSAYFDRQIFGIPHLWPWGLTPGHGVTFDPEGLLSTLPALATLLFGVLAGDWLRTTRTPAQKALVLAITVATLTLIALALTPSMPLIKKIWSPTFAVFSAGIALLLFSSFYFLLDVRKSRRPQTILWTTPLQILGANAIFAFILSGSLTTLSDTLHLPTRSGPLTLHQAGYHYIFATWLGPIHASLAYALSAVLLNIALLTPLYRKRIFLRI